MTKITTERIETLSEDELNLALFKLTTKNRYFYNREVYTDPDSWCEWYELYDLEEYLESLTVDNPQEFSLWVTLFTEYGHFINKKALPTDLWLKIQKEAKQREYCLFGLTPETLPDYANSLDAQFKLADQLGLNYKVSWENGLFKFEIYNNKENYNSESINKRTGAELIYLSTINIRKKGLKLDPIQLTHKLAELGELVEIWINKDFESALGLRIKEDMVLTFEHLEHAQIRLLPSEDAWNHPLTQSAFTYEVLRVAEELINHVGCEVPFAINPNPSISFVDLFTLVTANIFCCETEETKQNADFAIRLICLKMNIELKHKGIQNEITNII